jgi:hypothetical protein
VSLGFDVGEIVAGSLDEEAVKVFSQYVSMCGLDRGVSSAVEHQSGFLAQQSGTIGSKSQILSPGLRVGLQEPICFPIGPSAFHLGCSVGREFETALGVSA